MDILIGIAVLILLTVIIIFVLMGLGGIMKLFHIPVFNTEEGLDKETPLHLLGDGLVAFLAIAGVSLILAVAYNIGSHII